MPFRDLPKLSRFLIALVAMLFVASAAYLAPFWCPVSARDLVLALIACHALSHVQVRLADEKGVMSLGFPAQLVVAMLWGPMNGAVIGFATGALATIGPFAVRRWRHGPGKPLLGSRILYNASGQGLSMAAAGLAYFAGGHPGAYTVTHTILFGLLATIAFFAINSGTTAAIIASSQRRPVFRFWYTDILWTFPYFLVSSAAALAFLLLVSGGLWVLTAFVVVPVFAVMYAYRRAFEAARHRHRQIADLEGLNDSMVASLAGAIDARTRREENHLSRVQQLALLVSERLGLSEDDRQAVRCAAMVHDIGKLGVPENILHKAGPLTPEEYELLKRHVLLGVEILRPVAFPWPVVDLVMAHHERWDGQGYPRGLKGEAIPLGARVIAVADAFDAAMQGGPGRPPMRVLEAARALRDLSGSFLDPHVVIALMEVLTGGHGAPSARTESARGKAPRRRETTIPDPGHASSPAWVPPAHVNTPAAPARIPAGPGVFAQIAHANADLISACERRKNLPDPLDLDGTLNALLEESLRLIPGSTACVALVGGPPREPDGGAGGACERGEQDADLAVTLARGLYSDRLSGLTLPWSDGAWHMALRESRTLVNAAPVPEVRQALPPAATPDLQSSLVVPLIHDGERLGVVCLFHTRREAYSEPHAERLALLCDVFSGSVAAGRRLRNTEDLANRDPLTQLANQRAMTRRLEEMLSPASTGAPFAVVLVDLDHFKAVNDSRGHQFGDSVLCEVARVIRSCVRPMDFLARYAGDEFVMLLGDADHDAAVRVCSRIASAVERMAAEAGFPLGASAGFGLFPGDGCTATELLDAADRRMYVDKSARRR